jgi:hypothetical protein
MDFLMGVNIGLDLSHMPESDVGTLDVTGIEYDQIEGSLTSFAIPRLSFPPLLHAL